jgi:hypothetical protein
MEKYSYISSSRFQIYNPVWKEFYTVLTELDIHMKLFRIIYVRLNEIYVKVYESEIVSDTFLPQMVGNKEMLYRCCFSTLLCNKILGMSRKTMRGDTESDSPVSDLC